MQPTEPERIGDLLVDFHWPAQRVIAEADGHLHHGTPAAFEHHRARDARMTAAGYRVVRFTYSQIEREDANLVTTLRTLLEN
jgi:very-short-patch-repair endonuclease